MSATTPLAASGSAPAPARTRASALSSLRGRGNWQLWVGGTVLALIALAALLAPLVAPYDPNRQDLTMVLTSPGDVHWAGTDGIGRDLLSRLIYGARVSLGVAGLGMALSIAVGVGAGMLAVFGGKWSERIVLRTIDVQLAFPYILLAVAITSAVRPSFGVLVGLMALAGWAGAARVVRSVALSERGKDYVRAAEMVGASRVRIARKYVFPSVLPSVLVLAPMQMSAMIVFEATLSFLGMGVRPPTATWGGIMLEGKDYLADAWWITTLTGLAIFVTALSLMLIGDGLQRLTGQRIDAIGGTVETRKEGAA
ncbi:ABC transporter permease [Conexibacter sp. JD483]|uniref:ABC transporter permease n=1 Tax=unclassified Conexibacter TaxID=2627773 RepID=UPI0027186CDC|nr:MULTISPECIES: ABC transporter permease [unclassified Conexibacter]MDO8187875.1 ABC transporter permease [Conexibacter sp. CPCC 205706]MDO8201227.1 ABC transporter permease [Conexibacter sp. CPCC 205762]MDR9369761.1 ABC transporter permease [Conexibacter sp. JD483]